MGCAHIPLRDICDAASVSSIVDLRISETHDEDANDLLSIHGRMHDWPALRSLAIPEYFVNEGEPDRLLHSPAMRQLQSLHFGMTWPGSLSVEPFDSTWPRLESLSIAAAIDEGLLRLLSSVDAPRLKSFRIKGGFHDPMDLSSVEKFARLPWLRELESLSLAAVWTDKEMLTLLRAATFQLKSLELHGEANRGRMTIINDRKLGVLSFRAWAGSGALQNLENLSIRYQRIGDELVDVVRSAKSGKLRGLELLDVDLTDEGAEALAASPEIAGLTDLNLQGNLLTARGIRALARSPYLTRLRSLRIGGCFFNPYYDEHPMMEHGDSAIGELLASPLLGRLCALSIVNARVGTPGISDLVSSKQLQHLRRLDLSFTPFGLERSDVLSRVDLPKLESLRLACCRLENQAIVTLVQGKLPSIRELDLSYNSIGPDGARALAAWKEMSRLRSLNLHDNCIGSAGLTALARRPGKGQLVALDVEQDCWNSRQQLFGLEAASAVATSDALARLDAFWAGIVDEYHRNREAPPFTAAGMEVLAAGNLRPHVRHALFKEMDPPEVDDDVLTRDRTCADFDEQDFRSRAPSEQAAE